MIGRVGNQAPSLPLHSLPRALHHPLSLALSAFAQGTFALSTFADLATTAREGHGPFPIAIELTIGATRSFEE